MSSMEENGLKPFEGNWPSVSRVRNVTQFYNLVRVIFKPIFIILAIFSTQIYNFETENYNFKIHIYNFC